MPKQLYFSKFPVGSQVFYRTKLSAAFVNLKPILPGHVLVIPQRAVPRLKDLTPSELTDLFTSVRKVQQVIEKVFSASASNIGIQDGVDAGQTVPHVHVHIIPRKKADFSENDLVYSELEKNEGNLASLYLTGNERYAGDERPPTSMRQAIPKDEDRKPRTLEEMEKEAQWLKGYFSEEQEKE
ncbi:Bis(5''-nucleosyl)-tetraphosphatase [asymmetrical] [Schizosaccharomyces pombe]|uniref:Bis(5'-nucleosyl)-tetraphosphatase [asymmetrical] n=1 Tax=Schizosaccharomyces pombe (strain 972 / ATCC 24843) TaxID=284812 RepID=APH1_SCHPO|nr:bis(5'-nucleosidyl)-tetraphosphatase [Schizosaccharomyces pombe]P49776.2 RecName: Full=Bis(5'-nucleosyl)-tetraphosphatase [asymmetrical]; AltName: Full=Diadenosine 5',5'''-P1,P4-tetraphosphate asymmetrical hydrolase; Short=Ap4A hydrolase; Short=Ap4Aase; Short=Diadenosine tetraphosphatase [Schizosaccharomyces pombe 972h-]AAC49143.1 diadenosine 5',5'''-P1,P4-tetraphosphate asymmetrical hydrolase [Schizosaccharomyces pombe]CAB09779.1 bis(5'-nucleosidyl)-tetraphosphatase [Schizosaccharomyces pomb|eukprot:NP_587836.1 bis(5'-nucleosidyl)-tetraphosphatase [Schizosaccharomyces pombe]